MDPVSIAEFAAFTIDAGALFVEAAQDRLDAACGVMVVPYHFNKNVLFGYGVFLWASKAGTGNSVVRAAEKWAKERGAKKMLLTNNDTLAAANRAAEYLTARGYKPEETNFVRTL